MQVSILSVLMKDTSIMTKLYDIPNMQWFIIFIINCIFSYKLLYMKNYKLKKYTLLLEYKNVNENTTLLHKRRCLKFFTHLFLVIATLQCNCFRCPEDKLNLSALLKYVTLVMWFKLTFSNLNYGSKDTFIRQWNAKRNSMIQPTYQNRGFDDV